MLDRILAATLRFVVTGLIALIAAAAVITAYTGFTELVRIHWRPAMGLLGVAAVCGMTAYAMILRRDDLADC